MTVSDPHDFHADHPEYEDAPANPGELADQLSPQARTALIAEAVDHYWGGWDASAAAFLKALGKKEAEWFG